MSDTAYALLLISVKQEFPDFKLRQKQLSLFMRTIGVCLYLITFGQMSRFMRDFVTTIGTTVYVPAAWDSWSVESRYVLLRHERVHMRQRAKYGSLIFALAYLFFPLPCVFAYARMRFEQEAYAESLKATVDISELGRQRVQYPRTKEIYVGYFTGASYFWTWPWRKSIENWYDRAVDEALKAR